MIQKKLTISPLKKDSREDVQFWMKKTPLERIAAVEDLRRDYWGADYGNKSGFPRVYKITKL